MNSAVDSDVGSAITAAKYRGDPDAWDMARRITAARSDVHDAEKATRETRTWDRGKLSLRPLTSAETADRQKALRAALATQETVHAEAQALCAQHGWVAPVPAPPTPFTGDDENSSYCGHTD